MVILNQLCWVHFRNGKLALRGKESSKSYGLNLYPIPSDILKNRKIHLNTSRLKFGIPLVDFLPFLSSFLSSFLFFFLFFLSPFLRFYLLESLHKQGWTEGEKQTPCWAWNLAWCLIAGPQDHYLSQSETLNWLSHSDTPRSFLYYLASWDYESTFLMVERQLMLTNRSGFEN